ncbi:MAG: nucleotidyltransferase family protein [[Clostridium] innocuum]
MSGNFVQRGECAIVDKWTCKGGDPGDAIW